MRAELLQDAQRLIVRLTDQSPDLVVYLLGDPLGVVALFRDLPTQEDQFLLLSVHHRAHPLAHAQTGDHRTGQLGNAFEIVRGARGDVVEDQVFGSAAAQQTRHVGLQLVAREQRAILFGESHGKAAHHATGDDADLLNGVGLRQDVQDDGMAGLMVGDDALLLVADDPALALRASDHAFDGLLELRSTDGVLVAAGGQDGSLVDDVLQVGAHETGGGLGDGRQVGLRLDRLALDVDLEDGFAPAHVGTIEDNTAVEAAGPEQGRIEHVWAVGRGHDDHVGVGVKAVHFDEHLVEGLLALVVAAAETRAALAAHGIDLVHEHDAGRMALRLLE